MDTIITSMDARTGQHIKIKTYGDVLEQDDMQAIWEILDQACRRKDVEFPDESIIVGTIPHVKYTYPEPDGDPSY